MKIKTKDFYKRVRQNLAKPMAAKGYRQTSGGLPSWHQQQGEQYLTIWFEGHQWGWDELWGSSFTVEFQLDPSYEPGVGHFDHRERLPNLLSVLEREQIRQSNNYIITEMPGYQQNTQVFAQADGATILLLGKDRHKQPYAPNQDIWFEYLLPAHIDDWTEYFVSVLDSAQARFIESLSPTSSGQ